MKMTVKVEQDGDEQRYKLCSPSKLGVKIPVSLPAGFIPEEKANCHVSKQVSMTYNTAKTLLEKYGDKEGTEKSTLTRAYFGYELEQEYHVGLFKDPKESKRFCLVCGRQKELKMEYGGCRCNANIVDGILESRRSYLNRIGDLLGYHLGDDEKINHPTSSSCQFKESNEAEDVAVVNVKGKWMLFTIPLPFKKSIIHESIPKFIALKNTSKVWNGRRWDEPYRRG
jgi:hypothetical protein